jgi:hypothetical protein
MRQLGNNAENLLKWNMVMNRHHPGSARNSAILPGTGASVAYAVYASCMIVMPKKLQRDKFSAGYPSRRLRSCLSVNGPPYGAPRTG